MFTSIFVPILTYGHESWVMNEKVRSLMQASKIFAKKSKALRCLANNAIRESQHRVATSPDRKIENGLDVQAESLWKRLPKQTVHAKVSGKRPVGRPRTRLVDYIKDLG